MKKWLLSSTLLCLLCYTQLSYAQKSYHPGSIIKTDGQTLEGFIEVRNWNNTPTEVRFKKKLNEERQVYPASQVQSFQVNDYVFEGAEVEIETSPSGLGDLEFDDTLHIAVRQTFLQKIVGGDISLFYHRNKMGKENFYLQKEGRWVLLRSKKYASINKEGKKTVRENRTYIGQLSEYLSACSSLQASLAQVVYTKKSVTQLMSSYYSCTGSVITYQKKKSKIPILIGVLAGMTNSTVSFESDNHENPYLTREDFPNSLDFAGGIFFDIILPFNKKRWSIYNEALITQLSTSTLDQNRPLGDSYTNRGVELAFTQLRVNTFFRYTYSLGKFSLFINPGVAHAFTLNHTNKIVVEVKRNSVLEYSETTAIPQLRPQELGTIIGLGAKFANFSIEGRYERGSALSFSQRFSSARERTYILLGYKF